MCGLERIGGSLVFATVVEVNVMHLLPSCSQIRLMDELLLRGDCCCCGAKRRTLFAAADFASLGPEGKLVADARFTHAAAVCSGVPVGAAGWGSRRCCDGRRYCSQRWLGYSGGLVGRVPLLATTAYGARLAVQCASWRGAQALGWTLRAGAVCPEIGAEVQGCAELALPTQARIQRLSRCGPEIMLPQRPATEGGENARSTPPEACLRPVWSLPCLWRLRGTLAAGLCDFAMHPSLGWPVAPWLRALQPAPAVSATAPS